MFQKVDSATMLSSRAFAVEHIDQRTADHLVQEAQLRLGEGEEALRGNSLLACRIQGLGHLLADLLGGNGLFHDYAPLVMVNSSGLNSRSPLGLSLIHI